MLNHLDFFPKNLGFISEEHGGIASSGHKSAGENDAMEFVNKMHPSEEKDIRKTLHRKGEENTNKEAPKIFALQRINGRK